MFLSLYTFFYFVITFETPKLFRATQMPFITFIYKIGKNNKTYYGKYCINSMSDDHEGLDNEVKYLLIKGLNEYRKKKNIQ
jgi:hypothetical protein